MSFEITSNDIERKVYERKDRKDRKDAQDRCALPLASLTAAQSVLRILREFTMFKLARR